MPERDKARYKNRIAEAMNHTSRYAFAGKARLARDCGLSKMSVIRLFSGEHHPSYSVVHLVTAALEKALDRRLDVRELVSYSGEWERSICDVCGCRCCLPDGAVREDGAVDPAFAGIEPGRWKSFPEIGENRTIYRREEA